MVCDASTSQDRSADLVMRLRRAQADAARLRARSAQIASLIASREDVAAGLYEDLARIWPERADRMRSQAAAARAFAAHERKVAREGRVPPAVRDGLSGADRGGQAG